MDHNDLGSDLMGQEGNYFLGFPFFPEVEEHFACF